MKNKWIAVSMTVGSILFSAALAAETPSFTELRQQFRAAHSPNPAEIALDKWEDIWQCQSRLANESAAAFTVSLFQFRKVPDTDVLVFNNANVPLPGHWFPGWYAFLDGNFFTTVPFQTGKSVSTCSGDPFACGLDGTGVSNNIFVRATNGQLVAEWTEQSKTASEFEAIAAPEERVTAYSMCELRPIRP